MIPELVDCIEAARDKKAEEIVVLDLRGLSDITDYFVICHGTSTRQVLAISDAVEERLAKRLELQPDHVEGRKVGDWVLMDYFNFVIHVFDEDKRAFFGLERLWGDAPRLELPASPGNPGDDKRTRLASR